MPTFRVTVYSTREYHDDEVDHTFGVFVEASDEDEAMRLVEDQCAESGCIERCEVQDARQDF